MVFMSATQALLLHLALGGPLAGCMSIGYVPRTLAGGGPAAVLILIFL